MQYGDQFIRLESNTGNQVLPGQGMRVMVHYKLPEKLNSPTGGYLFIFYNKDGELPGGVQPFRFVAPDTCYFGEMAMPKPDATIAQLGNSTQRETLQGLRNQFSRVEAFHIKAVKKGPNSLRYRVQFQNIGEGEVKHVSVAIKSSAEQNTGIRSLEGLLLDGDKDGRAGGDVTVVLEAYHCQ